MRTLAVAFCLTAVSTAFAVDRNPVDRRLHPGTWRRLESTHPNDAYRPRHVASPAIVPETRRSLSVEPGTTDESAPVTPPSDGGECRRDTSAGAAGVETPARRSLSVEPATAAPGRAHTVYVSRTPPSHNRVGETVRRRLHPGRGFGHR